MRTISRSVVAIVCMAIIAAGAASGDPSPWSSKKPPARQDGWAARGEERPLLVGRVVSDHRGARYLEVRGHSTTYVVDLARTKIEGARLGKIERGDRVVVWGRVIRHRTIEAARIRVLRDSDKLPCSQCGRTDCFHSDRHHYEPGVTPSRPHKESSMSAAATLPTGAWSVPLSRRPTAPLRCQRGKEWRVEVPTSAQIRRGSSRSRSTRSGGEYVRVRGERLAGQRFRAERVDVDPLPPRAPIRRELHRKRPQHRRAA